MLTCLLWGKSLITTLLLLACQMSFVLRSVFRDPRRQGGLLWITPGKADKIKAYFRSLSRGERTIPYTTRNEQFLALLSLAL